MIPSFSYAELQQRFCEGFGFFPFEALSQHNEFIYKCYVFRDETPALLERHNQDASPGKIHAFVLLHKLQQCDIPIADKLLTQLSSAHSFFNGCLNSITPGACSFKKISDALHTYFRILTIYQLNLQQRIVTQLTSPDEVEDRGDQLSRAENIYKIQLLIREFIKSTDAITTFLQNIIGVLPGTGTLILQPTARDMLGDLIRSLHHFGTVQKKTDYVMSQWKEEITHWSNLRLLN